MTSIGSSIAIEVFVKHFATTYSTWDKTTLRLQQEEALGKYLTSQLMGTNKERI